MNQAVLEQKKQLVEEIANKMQNSASTVVCEYRGLTVSEVTELRRALRAEGVEFIVYKNSMVQRAAEQLGHNDLLSSLTGPNAIAFSSDAALLPYPFPHGRTVFEAKGSLLLGASEAKHQVFFGGFVIVYILRHAVVQV